MKNILQNNTMQEVIRTISNMYRLGWDERNGGNISIILDEKEMSEYIDIEDKSRIIDVYFDASPLIGKLFLVTGTGKYFKNVEYAPDVNLGIIRILPSGKTASIVWGFSDGGRPTSELPAHLMSHIERLKIDPNHRVIMHTHPTSTLAMTLVHSLDERAFTRTIWKVMTECIVVFPEGIGVLPWMVCGNEEIGRATAEKLKEYRLCIWATHGIFGCGKDLDETFGLIETVEKGAIVYMQTIGTKIINTITDDELKAVAKRFNLTPKAEFLD
ncbi:MAG TPA: rhamnulose-1-phosphate aldolase [Clostridia bacterium]|nr:rhamnulose-1-phosphate aldolase [Clostridia bacterium]